MGRKTPLHVYAPAPGGELIERHLTDFDIHLAFQLIVHTITGRSLKQILDDKRVEVYSFPLRHRITSYGFLFREKAPDRNIIREKISELNLSVAEISYNFV